MNNDFIYKNDEKEKLQSIIPNREIKIENQALENPAPVEEFIKELPAWDLEPLYEAVRRVNRK